LLGQRTLRLASDRDPFLAEAIHKYGAHTTDPPEYRHLLEGGAQDSPETALAWMQERCDRLPIPEHLRVIGQFAWSGVYTSAIDTLWLKAFSQPWRQTQPIHDDRYRPYDPRNRSKLHCTFLFGSVGRTDERERPPLSKADFRRRRQEAVVLARRLPELVTPLGLLVIEGYHGASDWLSPDELLPIVDELSPGQVHVFSTSECPPDDDDICTYVQTGKIALHAESLAQFLTRGSDQGSIALGLAGVVDAGTRALTVRNAVLAIPKDLWNQTSRSACILHDGVMTPPRELSRDALYREFREFLSQAADTPQWSGYSRGFAFFRDFEKRLSQVVSDRLVARELSTDPVVVHGQTATGKSMALGALAYRVRRDGTHPVLHISGHSYGPRHTDIDAFCQWTEDNGAPACLVVWDAMPEDIAQYSELLSALTRRGRKVVLVGSHYLLGNDNLSGAEDTIIEAPACLTEEEVDRFRLFLAEIDPALEGLVREKLREPDEQFLVALYRLLPDTRRQLRTGVSTEVAAAEREIRRRASDPEARPVVRTTLGQALADAGLIDAESLLSAAQTEVGDEMLDEVGQLMGLIMVPGRFGLWVPFELLLRALGKELIADFHRLVADLDVFRWAENDVGNIAVGPRSRLEARLLVQSRLGSARAELALARQLILEVRQESGRAHDPEIEFAVRLSRRMGSEGQDAAYFRPVFGDLADVLRELRELRGVENPRLMLQEANLLREWVTSGAASRARDGDWTAALERAEAVLDRALDLSREWENRLLESTILTELAALYGANMVQTHLVAPDEARMRQLFERAQSLAKDARARNARNFHAVDILAWTTRDILRARVLDATSALEAQADVVHALDMVDPSELGVVQRERYLTRRLQLARQLEDEEMAQEALHDLAAEGSAAGHYLIATETAWGDMAAHWARRGDMDRQGCTEALDYLDAHMDEVRSDLRCMHLRLRLWWTVNARHPMFAGERQAVPFGGDQWRDLLAQLDHLMRVDLASNEEPTLQYMRGLAMFHLRDLHGAMEVFRDVQRLSDQVGGRRRVIRHYVVSETEGIPQVFTGTVDWTDGKRGEVFVDQLRHRVNFRPYDFRRPDIQQGDALGDFHIAFNFLGPIADPLHYMSS